MCPWRVLRSLLKTATLFAIVCETPECNPVDCESSVIWGLSWGTTIKVGVLDVQTSFFQRDAGNLALLLEQTGGRRLRSMN